MTIRRANDCFFCCLRHTARQYLEVALEYCHEGHHCGRGRRRPGDGAEAARTRDRLRGKVVHRCFAHLTRALFHRPKGKLSQRRENRATKILPPEIYAQIERCLDRCVRLEWLAISFWRAAQLFLSEVECLIEPEISLARLIGQRIGRSVRARLLENQP